MVQRISKLLLLMAGFSNATALAGSREQALILFKTLTGTPLSLSDPRLNQMVAHIDAGNVTQAAAIATQDDNFYDVSVRHFGSHMFNRDEFQNADLDDATAFVVGHTANDGDTREMLYGDFWYLGNSSIPGLPAATGPTNNHFKFLDASRLSLRRNLVRSAPQRAGIAGAGVLTTRAWGKHHLSAGTNRRAAEFALREFMCLGIREVADGDAPTHRIRRDVDRAPGGSTQTFHTRCKTCHSILDGFAGAFAYLNFTFVDAMVKEDGNLAEGGVQAKMNQNPSTYPAGYVTNDDSFINNAIYGKNAAMGWRGPLEGNGPAEFGKMLSNSFQFSRCMATRVFSQLCVNTDFVVDRLTSIQRQQLEAASPQIEELAKDFETNGYRLRKLFESTAALPKCLNR